MAVFPLNNIFFETLYTIRLQMQNVLKKEETIVNSTTRSENIQIRDQPIWEIKKNCNVPINSGLHLPL